MAAPPVLVANPNLESGALVERALARDFGSSFQLAHARTPEQALREVEEAIADDRPALVLVAGVDPGSGAGGRTRAQPKHRHGPSR